MKKPVSTFSYRVFYIHFCNLVFEISIPVSHPLRKKEAIENNLIGAGFFKDLYEEIW
jgi:hypothetical protein